LIGDSFDILKTYLEGASSNKETMLKEILKAICTNHNPAEIPWPFRNIHTFSQQKSSNQLFQMIPEFMVILIILSQQ
jgi:hypothetical protein